MALKAVLSFLNADIFRDERSHLGVRGRERGPFKSEKTVLRTGVLKERKLILHYQAPVLATFHIRSKIRK